MRVPKPSSTSASIVAVVRRPWLWPAASRLVWHVAGAGRVSSRRGRGRGARARYWEFRRETVSGSTEAPAPGSGGLWSTAGLSPEQLVEYLEWLRHAPRPGRRVR